MSWSIYTLSDPITKEIRYIGVTRNSLNKRLSGHIKDAQRYDYHNSRWIRSLLKNNLKPLIEQLDECDVYNWNDVETYWIAQFKCWGFNLTNSKDLSTGISTYSDETIKKLRAAQLGRKLSEETKEKIRINTRISLIGKNRKLSEETKEKLRIANIGKRALEKTKEKMSIAHKNRILRKIDQYSLGGIFIKRWNSIKEAEQHLNIKCISRSCRNINNQSGGFMWKYVISEIIINNIDSYKPYCDAIKIIQYDLQGNELNKFSSIRMAYKITKIYHDGIKKSCQNNIPVMGFIFKYQN